MAGVGANDVHASFTANHLTVFADPFNACADFHRSCSQNSGFIKARQYRNESHLPTRAIFLRNAFFRMEQFEMGRQLASSNHQSALCLSGVVHLGPETLVPAANPIHRLTRIVVLTPVRALVQLSGNCPYFVIFAAVCRKRRPYSPLQVFGSRKSRR